MSMTNFRSQVSLLSSFSTGTKGSLLNMAAYNDISDYNLIIRFRLKESIVKQFINAEFVKIYIICSSLLSSNSLFRIELFRVSILLMIDIV